MEDVAIGFASLAGNTYGLWAEVIRKSGRVSLFSSSAEKSSSLSLSENRCCLLGYSRPLTGGREGVPSRAVRRARGSWMCACACLSKLNDRGLVVHIIRVLNKGLT